MIYAAALGIEVLLARSILLTFKEVRTHLQAIYIMWPLHGVQQQVH